MSTSMSTGQVGRVMTPPGTMAMMPAGMMPAGKPAAAQASTGPLQSTAVSISGHTVQSQYFWGPPVSVNHLSHQSHSPPTPFQDVRLQMGPCKKQLFPFLDRMVVLQALVMWTISPHHGDVSTIGHSFLVLGSSSATIRSERFYVGVFHIS